MIQPILGVDYDPGECFDCEDGLLPTQNRVEMPPGVQWIVEISKPS